MWLSIFSLIVMAVIYQMDQPLGGRNGGTVLGYTYGGIAAAGILYLMWYGMRKRSYYSSATTVKGWLAAHVWIGVALLFLVPLHSGMAFGWNVHTLAYVLMALTIFSGIWGAVNYSTLADQVQSHRGGGSLKSIFQQIEMYDNQIENILQGKSDAALALRQKGTVNYKPSIMKSLFGSPPKPVRPEDTAELLVAVPENEKDDALTLIGVMDKRCELLADLHSEIRIQTLLKLWLYFHLPLSFGCVAALFIHIFVVFYYW